MTNSAISKLDKFWMLVFILIPFLAFIFGVIQTWGWGIDLISISLLVVFYFFTGLGITIGYHRYFTHDSFKIRFVWLKKILAILGSMAGQGPVSRWVGTHWQHHENSDKEGDAHSPHLHGKGFVNICKGYWFSHIGWMFVTEPPAEKYTNKFKRDNGEIMRISDMWFLWFVGGLILQPVIGVGLRRSFTLHTFSLDFVWSLVRLFLIQHSTWCINSVCHIWGKRPFETGDMSTNNVVISLISHGEGNHNCHHAFPRSAKHGLLPWQFDLSWIIICLLEKIGLVCDVCVPSEEKINKKLKNRAP